MSIFDDDIDILRLGDSHVFNPTPINGYDAARMKVIDKLNKSERWDEETLVKCIFDGYNEKYCWHGSSAQIHHIDIYMHAMPALINYKGRTISYIPPHELIIPKVYIGKSGAVIRTSKNLYEETIWNQPVSSEPENIVYQNPITHVGIDMLEPSEPFSPPAPYKILYKYYYDICVQDIYGQGWEKISTEKLCNSLGCDEQTVLIEYIRLYK
jgi:hypothetical protein